jgi:hypothetical protein
MMFGFDYLFVVLVFNIEIRFVTRNQKILLNIWNSIEVLFSRMEYAFEGSNTLSTLSSAANDASAVLQKHS